MGGLAHALIVATGVVLARGQDLLEGFESPSTEFRPWYRYWLPDASVEHEQLEKDVQALKDVGAGGMEFIPFYNYGFGSLSGPPSDKWDEYAFGSPAYKDVLTTALSSLENAGLSVDLAIGASQGQGVPVEPLTPGLAVHLVYGKTTVEAGESYSGPVPEANRHPNLLVTCTHPHEIFGPDRLVAVVAGGVKSTTPISDVFDMTTLDESSLIDLTDEVVEGEISWQAPDNLESYRIFGLYETFTNQRSCDAAPGAQTAIQNGSWVTDHFSAAGSKLVTDFWEANLLDDEVKALLATVGENHMELQAALWWTPDFIERFEEARGYSPIRYLPLMFHQSNAFTMDVPPYNTTYVLDPVASDQSFFIHDYRTTLNEGYLEYLGAYEKWAQSLGLSHSCQVAYNLPLDMLADVQQVSVPELESLGFPEIDQSLQYAGPAHLGGHIIISTEVGADLSGGYSLSVPDLVGIFHDAFAGGINKIKVHGMAYGGEYHATWPGYTPFQYSYSELWGPRQPAWNYMNDTMAYTARNQLVLQSGVPKRDVAFYIYKQPWVAQTFYEGSDLRDQGYSHEYLSSLNLASDAVSFSNGLLAANGPAYKALVIYNQTYISPEASEKVLSLAQGGLPIVVYGGLPNITIGKAGQDVVAENMAALAASGVDNYQIIDDEHGVAAALEQLGVLPRVSVLSTSEGPSSSLYSVWREGSDADFVFLFSKGDANTFVLDFEVGGNKVPYKLDAWTGTDEEYLPHKRTAGGVALQVSLKAGQAAIFGFGPAKDKGADIVVSHSANVEKVKRGPDGAMAAWVNDGAEASLGLASGRSVSVPALAGNASLVEQEIGPWDVTLQSWEPSSDNTTSLSEIRTVELGSMDELVPWSEIPEIQSISGVGVYTATFQSEANVTYGSDQVVTLIHFGPVLNTLRAWVNDKELPAVDIADAEADVSSYLMAGENTIRVEVSSTLFNAVKERVNWVKQFGGGPNIPMMYTEPSWQTHGLVGPVHIRTLREVCLEGEGASHTLLV